MAEAIEGELLGEEFLEETPEVESVVVDKHTDYFSKIGEGLKKLGNKGKQALDWLSVDENREKLHAHVGTGLAVASAANTIYTGQSNEKLDALQGIHGSLGTVNDHLTEVKNKSTTKIDLQKLSDAGRNIHQNAQVLSSSFPAVRMRTGKEEGKEGGNERTNIIELIIVFMILIVFFFLNYCMKIYNYSSLVLREAKNKEGFLHSFYRKKMNII